MPISAPSAHVVGVGDAGAHDAPAASPPATGNDHTPAEDAAPPVQTVLSEAAARHKPVLLVFHAVWCKPCVHLENEVFVNTDVARAIGEFVVQRYDIEVGEGQQAAKQFGVSAVPALVVLSPRGEEIDRIGEQEPGALARALWSVRDVALRAPIDDSAIASEKDPRVLLVTGRLAEKASKYEVAEGAYRAAVTASRGGQKELAATAAFALLRIDALNATTRSHSRDLLSFAARFPASDEALRALDGIAAFPPRARPDAGTIRAVAANMIEARRSANDRFALRRISDGLRALGDEPDANKARDLAGAQGADTSAPAFVSHGDPLAPQCGSQPTNSVPPEVLELFKQEILLGRRIADACKEIARTDDEQYVRLSIRDGRVERAVLLDPEAPKELRTCMESVAAREPNVPAGFGARRVVRVMFPPKQ